MKDLLKSYDNATISDWKGVNLFVKGGRDIFPLFVTKEKNNKRRENESPIHLLCGLTRE